MKSHFCSIHDPFLRITDLSVAVVLLEGMTAVSFGGEGVGVVTPPPTAIWDPPHVQVELPFWSFDEHINGALCCTSEEPAKVFFYRSIKEQKFDHNTGWTINFRTKIPPLKHISAFST